MNFFCLREVHKYLVQHLLIISEPLKELIISVSILRFLLILLTVTSCGGENLCGTRWLDPPQQEQAIAPEPKSFNTRLNSTLLIKGNICVGTETTESGGHGDQCLAGQYLVYIDNVNTCDENGMCTEFEVIPIVGELVDIGARTSGMSVFIIDPISEVSDTEETILNSINVRSDLNGNGSVTSND